LRSILKKVRVERQADLLLVLASVPSSPDGEAAEKAAAASRRAGFRGDETLER